MAAAAKKTVNWIAVERDYSAGVKSLRLIGKEQGVSNPAILKRAKRDGWVRDLKERIRAKAAEKVSKDAVSKVVSNERAVTERQIVDANAEVQAKIIREHRSEIGSARGIVKQLLAELGAMTISAAELDEFCEAAALKESSSVPAEKHQAAFDKALATFLKLTGLGGRATAVKTLLDALKTAIALEREAFGISEEMDTEDALIASLKRIRGIDQGDQV